MIEENENSKKKNPKNFGRVRGQNKLTKESKAVLFEALKTDYHRLDKLINCCSFDERAKLLKGFTKYLTTGDDKISQEMKSILWEQLEPHYKKLQFYVPHLTAKDKITVLRGFLTEITPVHRKEAINIIVKQKIKIV
ncbi:hypothetical protein BWK59_02545 [Flavobacterium davisii]|uniref:Uncharacterized protein n=1 Tax=Flavobacterium davisii TaxID=2906077 RepID=A0A246GKX1_9FLAO|nr:hypothetical protein [Flavobacterium davisii]OWP85001.1 hypothetical protein BWK59_02545 [Flavobacterium davisii]